MSNQGYYLCAVVIEIQLNIVSGALYELGSYEIIIYWRDVQNKNLVNTSARLRLHWSAQISR